ncbi:MAG: carbon-nitrogen hydrolase family protein [Pseudomonadota bacterium]
MTGDPLTGRAFTVACIQTNSTREPETNISAVSDLIRRARDLGGEFILVPEIVNMLEPKRDLLLAKARAEADDPTLAAFRDLARETGAWLLAGSLALRAGESPRALNDAPLPGRADDEAERCVNRSILIAPSGDVAARYDKIHMFDVDLGQIEGVRERYHESRTYRPGAKAVTADLPWGRLGMTICYDMRFPHLYRALAKKGAEFFSVPAAFTRPTGRAHWHVLLRARAIENGAFVFAPAQCGEHAEGRKTYGHSLIVDPWGEVLADGGEEVGVVTARIDPARVAEARAKIPAIFSDRDFN